MIAKCKHCGEEIVQGRTWGGMDYIWESVNNKLSRGCKKASRHQPATETDKVKNILSHYE